MNESLLQAPLKRVAWRPPEGEWANSLTHGIGLIASLLGGVLLVILAWPRGDRFVTLSCLIYATTLVTLYACSTLYHCAHDPCRKERLRIADHAAIYLLIAGSYTPFTLTLLRGGWGWAIFAGVWALAFAGVSFKLYFSNRYSPISTATYVAMGWLVLIASKPILEFIPAGALLLLLMGGILYTGGILFFAGHRIPHHHALWHLCVLGGSACHYAAVLFYIIPPGQ